MRSLSSFDRTLFYDSSPATDQFFEDRASQLFESDDERSWVQIHIQPHIPEGQQDPSNQDSPSRAKFRMESTSDSDCDSPSILPLSVDQIRHLQGDPPQYIGAPGLILRKVSDASELRKIAMVRPLS